MASLVYHQIHDENSLEQELKEALRLEGTKYHRAIRFLFYSPEELTEYIRLCDVNIGRGYGPSYNISLRELALTKEIKVQLYAALKEHVRRQRNLTDLNFQLGTYQIDREKMSVVGKRHVRDLDAMLDTRAS